MKNMELFNEDHIGNTYRFLGFQKDKKQSAYRNWSFTIGKIYTVRSGVFGFFRRSTIGLIDETNKAASRNFNFELELVTENK